MKQGFLTLFIAAALIGPVSLTHVLALPPSSAATSEDPMVHPPIHVKPFSTLAPAGYSPMQIEHAYGFDLLSCHGTLTCGIGKTIAIVDAYHDPTAASDLATFSTQFGLPQCTVANQCFSQVYASGSKPKFNSGWALEMSLDIQWAHAIAPGAKILLVEAQNSYTSSLMHAVDVAVSKGANVVSMSWGGSEFSSESSYDSHFNNPTATNNHVAFFASSGDSGSGVEYPAASPYVTSVGGTTLPLDSAGNLIASEVAWSGSGGGISAYESQPVYQSSYIISQTRAVPDVSYDADPNTGVSVYDSAGYYGQKGWFTVGGTSAGSPQWAALAAISDTMNPLMTPNNTSIYNSASTSASYATNFRDIITGSNGGFNAGTGYDLVTGLGSPLANNLTPSL